MAQYQIIFWRDIPAQVKCKEGRKRAGRPLPDRFPVAIDEAAMRAGVTDSDAYLQQWSNSAWQTREGDPETLAANLVSELDTDYPPARLRLLIQQGGWETEPK